MKRTIELSENDYRALKEDGVQNHLALADSIIAHSVPYEETPQGECEKCDFRKFTETFIDGIVDVMNKNGITSVEQLSEILKGGAE